jgi:hypothetical protein
MTAIAKVYAEPAPRNVFSDWDLRNCGAVTEEAQPPPRRWVRTMVVALISLLAVSLVWAVAPIVFPAPHSPAVTLLGINRIVTYEGSTIGYLSGNLTSGCNVCPLTINAGSSIVVWIGTWVANASSTPGRVVVMNWSVVSPYPFDAISYHPPSPPLVYSWNETDTVGPYGNGGFAIALTIVIPDAYSNLPAMGNITFTMYATAL